MWTGHPVDDPKLARPDEARMPDTQVTYTNETRQQNGDNTINNTNQMATSESYIGQEHTDSPSDHGHDGNDKTKLENQNLPSMVKNVEEENLDDAEETDRLLKGDDSSAPSDHGHDGNDKTKLENQNLPSVVKNVEEENLVDAKETDRLLEGDDSSAMSDHDGNDKAQPEDQNLPSLLKNVEVKENVNDAGQRDCLLEGKESIGDDIVSCTASVGKSKENDKEKALIRKESLDRACRILENSVRFNDDDLDRLMRDIFDFPYQVVEDIKRQPGDTKSKLRSAFDKWISTNASEATPENLIDALYRHQWNAEAHKISDYHGIPRREGTTMGKDLTDLDRAIRICERRVPVTEASAFARECLEIESINTHNKKSKEIIREAFGKWQRIHSSNATVEGLIKRLAACDTYGDALDEICETLGQPNPMEDEEQQIAASKEDSKLDVKKEESDDKKTFIDDTTVYRESPVEKNKAGPMYNPEDHHQQVPVRETTAPTTDETPRMDGEYDRSPVESPTIIINPTTVPKGFHGSPARRATYDDSYDDPSTVKVDDENYDREIEEVDVVNEPNAGGGKAPNVTSEEPSEKE